MLTVRPGARLLTPLFLSTVTPGKLPTFWFNPVRELKSELFPLLGLPTRAIWRLFFFKKVGPSDGSSGDGGCKGKWIHAVGDYEIGKRPKNAGGPKANH